MVFSKISIFENFHLWVWGCSGCPKPFLKIFGNFGELKKLFICLMFSYGVYSWASLTWILLENSIFWSFTLVSAQLQENMRFSGVSETSPGSRHTNMWPRIDTIMDWKPIWVPFIARSEVQYVHPPGTPTHPDSQVGAKFRTPFWPIFGCGRFFRPHIGHAAAHMGVRSGAN